MLEEHIEKEEKHLTSLQAQSQPLDTMLKEAQRELREARARRKE